MENDLISRSALFKDWDALDETQDPNLLVDAMIKATQEAPAVEVVRCKDCKHRGSVLSCPMCHMESDEYDDYIFDRTKDLGYCDCGAKMDAEAEG